jgi:hypothetical protein
MGSEADQSSGLRLQSEIQGPFSFSKCCSNRNMKIAAAAQMTVNAINHTMITAQFDTRRTFCRPNAARRGAARLFQKRADR